MLGKIVTVTVDRALGSHHPDFPLLVYPINYGFIKGIMAPDGEDQDAYLIGINQAVTSFRGRVIGVIHRQEDVETKWVVAPIGQTFSKEEILSAVSFQEQFFTITLETWAF
ncbi:inorganic diphosphatase [Enterococcus sp. LJL98]